MSRVKLSTKTGQVVCLVYVLALDVAAGVEFPPGMSSRLGVVNLLDGYRQNQLHASS